MVASQAAFSLAYRMAGSRGVGKSHALAVFGALTGTTELRSTIEDAHVATSARRLMHHRYMIVRVERGTRPTFIEELAAAFTEMDDLARERPKRQPYELAEHIIRKIDAAITQDELWERINFIRAAYTKGGARNL